MNVICTVIFTEEDVEEVFGMVHGRKPSSKELADCLDGINPDVLETSCIDKGREVMMDYIKEMVRA